MTSRRGAAATPRSVPIPAALSSGAVEVVACATLTLLVLLMPIDDLGWVGVALEVVTIGAAAFSPWAPRVSGGLTLIAVACWLLLPGTPGISPMAVFVPIFTLARKGDTAARNTLSVAAVALLSFVLAMRSSDSLTEGAATLLLLTASCALVWFIGHGLHSASTLLAQADEQRRAEIRAMRLEIARELHDTIARANTSIVLRAEATLATPGLPDRVRDDLADIMATGRRSTGQLRTMLALLRSDEDDLTDQGLAAPRAGNSSLEALMAEQVAILRAHGLGVSHELRWNPLTCGPRAAAVMGNIMVEAAANMVKHARPGGDCLIMIDQTGESLEGLFVNPFDPQVRRDEADSSGMGLVGIRERAGSAGGNVTISASEPNWMVHVVLPLTEEEDNRELEDHRSGDRRR